MGEGDTALNAVVGAVVTTVLSFTAISPVLGGAVAAYLQGGDRSEGLRIGAISGAVATVPFALLGFVVFGLFFFSVEAGAVASAFFVVFFLGVLVYTVVLSAIGGYVGVYVREEFLD